MTAKAATAGQIAKALGITERYVRELFVQGMPRTIPKARAWYTAKKTARELERSSTLDEARRRKTEAEAKLAEFEVAKAEGELVTVSEAASQVEQLLDRLRARILAVPGKYAPQLLGKRTMAEAVGALETITAELMADLAGTVDE